jgi:hypothetical protein
MIQNLFLYFKILSHIFIIDNQENKLISLKIYIFLLISKILLMFNTINQIKLRFITIKMY